MICAGSETGQRKIEATPAGCQQYYVFGSRHKLAQKLCYSPTLPSCLPQYHTKEDETRYPAEWAIRMLVFENLVFLE